MFFGENNGKFKPKDIIFQKNNNGCLKQKKLKNRMVDGFSALDGRENNYFTSDNAHYVKSVNTYANKNNMLAIMIAR